MNKEEFVKEVENNIRDKSLNDLQLLMMEIMGKVPNDLYDKILCVIENYNGNNDRDNKKLEELKDELIVNLSEIENGDACIRCYSYGTGSYSYYDEDLDYVYYPSNYLNDIFHKLYDFVVKSVFRMNYNDAIEMFDKFLNAEYTYEEVGNPEYDDSDEVYDTFYGDIKNIKNDLMFDFNELLLYVIYAVVMIDDDDKYEKIDKYMKYGNVVIEKVKDIGIEDIENYDEFYKGWLEYLDLKYEINKDK